MSNTRVPVSGTWSILFPVKRIFLIVRCLCWQLCTHFYSEMLVKFTYFWCVLHNIWPLYKVNWSERSIWVPQMYHSPSLASLYIGVEKNEISHFPYPYLYNVSIWSMHILLIWPQYWSSYTSWVTLDHMISDTCIAFHSFTCMRKVKSLKYRDASFQ